MVSLTPKQIQDITETWETPAKNIFDSGEYILYKFFEKHPQYQNFFKKFKGVPLSDLKGKPAFRAHASRIMNRFSATVDCLQYDGGVEEIIDLWHEVGSSHLKHKLPQKAFLDLQVVILEVLSDVCNLNDEQKEAWGILLDFGIKCASETMGNN